MKINDIRIGNGGVLPGGKIDKTPGGDFKELLDKKTGSHEVNFSKHAIERISARNLELGREETEKISTAIDLAGKKGIKNSLIIMGDMVLIANIQSRTIVTVIDRQNMKDKVFTNVDGAVNI